MRKIIILSIIINMILFLSQSGFSATDEIKFDFEKESKSKGMPLSGGSAVDGTMVAAVVKTTTDTIFGSGQKSVTEGWIIPNWAYDQDDHKAKSIELSTDQASSGESSLKINCDFPGDFWTAAVIEWERDIDLSGYESISADVFLPRKAPKGLLQARLILTIGDGWHFTEMRRPVLLTPGKWHTIKAKLESTEPAESDWKGRGERQLFKNIRKVKKIAVRVEYNAAAPARVGPRYHGPIYVDNIVIK